MSNPNDDDTVLPRRLQRLADELDDEQVPALCGSPDHVAGLVELAYALRPPVHEDRVPTYGAILTGPSLPEAMHGRGVTLIDIDIDPALARKFADGLTTFAVRRPDTVTQIAAFSQALIRESDLVRLRARLDATIIQRHPTGQVRIYNSFGVVRWNGVEWYHEAPLDKHIDRLRAVAGILPVSDMMPLLEFAVHELSPRHIGATLVWRPLDVDLPPERLEPLLPNVPRLRVGERSEADALAHVLAQTDGAAVFGPGNELIALGMRLDPSPDAVAAVPPSEGTRHTSAMRYSYDDHRAVMIVVSGDGPVSIMHRGAELATQAPIRIG